MERRTQLPEENKKEMEYFVVCNEVCQSPAKLSTVLKRKLEILWLSGSGIMDIKIKALAGEVENIKWKIWKKLRLESFFLASIYLKIKWNSRKKNTKEIVIFRTNIWNYSYYVTLYENIHQNLQSIWWKKDYSNQNYGMIR